MGGKTRCPNCGRPIDDFALSCKYCGYSFYSEHRSGRSQRLGYSQRLNQQQYSRAAQQNTDSTYRIYPSAPVYPEPKRSSGLETGTAVTIALMAGILVLQVVQLIVLLVR